jgi:hypothetical protein
MAFYFLFFCLGLQLSACIKVMIEDYLTIELQVINITFEARKLISVPSPATKARLLSGYNPGLLLAFLLDITP